MPALGRQRQRQRGAEGRREAQRGREAEAGGSL